jgi:hypothetical protein
MLQYTGARMLTPAEWWIYHDYCMRNKPELHHYNECEWLDGLVKDKDLLVGNKIENNELVDSKQIFGGITTDFGEFARGDLDPETGLPKVITNAGNYFFMRHLDINPAALYVTCSPIDSVEINTQDPEKGYEHIGMRPCLPIFKKK